MYCIYAVIMYVVIMLHYNMLARSIQIAFKLLLQVLCPKKK